MKNLFAVLLALIAVSAYAADKRPAEFDDPDVQRLIKAEYFVFGPAGYAGAVSIGESAFRALAGKREAIRYYLVAFDYGTPEAKCYALVALREESSKLFIQDLAIFRASPPKDVVLIRGCIISHAQPLKVADAIESGQFAKEFEKAENDG